MGIFEKSIPKYTYNMANEVVVAPQDVYVDDIFDPILNARVKAAMREKYGGGLYGVLGGYEELLKNTWTGREGILGPGMGLLSTFGRSMEKADDIVLGALTEGIKAMSFQGATNPLKNIFTNDYDYTGKGLLASVANIGRPLVGGTTVDESDFGGAWTVPALGIELGTDVGILGGGLARKFAPEVRDFTAKQLFENLGKSDLKTSVGTIGQLMSEYDDLMAKIAIGAAAPGLRPAFKALKHRLGSAFATHSPEPWAEVTKLLHTVEDDSADIAVRMDAQKQLQENEMAQQLTTLFKDSDAALSRIPDMEDMVSTAGAEEPTIDRLYNAMLLDFDKIGDSTDELGMQQLRDHIKLRSQEYNKNLYAAFDEARKIAESETLKWYPDSHKLIGVQDTSAAEMDVMSAMETVSGILDDLNAEYAEPIREMLEDAYAGHPRRFIDALKSKEWSDNIATNSQILRAVEPKMTYFKSTSPYRVSPSLKSAVDGVGSGGVKYSYKTLQNLNSILDPKLGLVPRFNNIQELKQFLEHPKFEAALEEFIPAQKLSKHASEGLSAAEVYAKEQAIANARRRKFINLMTSVYFPKKGISTFDYTKNLVKLEEFISYYTNPNMLSDSTKFIKSLTAEEFAAFKADPENVLPLKQFLTNKGLLYADEYNRTIDGAAAKYLLKRKFPTSFKGNQYLKDAAIRKSKRLRTEYNKEVRRMVEDLERVRSIPLEANTFLDNLRSAVDDISQNYLQLLRDEVPHPLYMHVKGTQQGLHAMEAAGTLPDKVSAYIDSTPYAIRAFDIPEFETYKASRGVSNYVRATVPDNATVEEFREFTRPLAPYLDIGYRNDILAPKSLESDKLVDTFYNEIVPLVEKVAEDPAYGNKWLNTIFAETDYDSTFKDVPDDVKEAILKLRDFFGAKQSKNKHTDAAVFRQLYRKAVPSVESKNFTKFVPKYTGKDADDLAQFLNGPQRPLAVELELIRINNRTGNPTLIQGKFPNEIFTSRIDDVLKDLGISDTEIDAIFKKVDKNGLAALSSEELKKYRAYTYRATAVLKDTPYGIYVRDPKAWTADGNWTGIAEAVRLAEGHLPSDKLNRIATLLDKERKQMQNLGTKKYPFVYTSEDKAIVAELSKFMPKDVVNYWHPSTKRGLFNFEIPSDTLSHTLRIGDVADLRPERLPILKFLKASAGKNIKLKDFKYVDYGLLYSKSGRETLTDVATRARLNMDYIPDTPAVFKDTAKDVITKTTTSKEAAADIAAIPESIVKASPETVAEVAYETPSLAESAVDDVIDEVLGDNAAQFIKDGGSEDPDVFKAMYGEDVWSLRRQIARATAVSSKNSHRKQRATLRRKPVKALLERIFKLRGDHLMNGGKMADFRRFVALRQQPHGDILKGEDFWNELRHSGMLGAVYAKGSKDADAVFDSLTKNAKLINDAAGENTVKVVMEEIPNNKVKVYLQFVYNKKGVIRINNAAEKLEKAAYETVVFSPPKAWTAEDLAFMNTPEMRQLAAYMDEAQVLANEQARYLGFAFDPNTAYTKHAMNRNVENAQWFNDTFYKDFSSENLDEFVNSISNLERYRKADHGSFGTVVNTRRFRGDVWMMDDGNKLRFNYDPYEMVTSTLADGAFANLQFQSYVDLFMNDNFKIKGIFNSVDELKEVLYKPLEDGSTSGNLRNLELCTMKLNADGKIIGLTKYDKLSDAGLAKALSDENTILVPANAISHIDNLLKKDIRMSNKFWTFINKHFTIPFKFGVLSNPGFLLGNMSDAYLKLATTMSEKYGTTVPEEAARVAGCLKRAELYQEQYGNAFDVWRKVSADNGIKLSDEALVPGIVAMSPKYNEQFLDWLDGRLRVEQKVQDPITGKIEAIETVVPCDLTDDVKNAAGIWVTLQTAQMNSDKLREFADLADLRNVSEFEMPTNWWTRITQGKGKYDKHKPSTWGVFMNNPPTSTMLGWSTGWEEVIRTASILDDLEHGYTLEELGALARGQKYTQADINFRVRLDEAKNTMFNAQFDYERGSDFMEGVGKVVPFPVFFLKNFAYWMELFEKNPQYVDNAIDIQEGLWSNRDEEHSKDSFAIEAKGRGAIPVGGKALPDWFKGYYKPAPLQSMFGAFNLLNDPVGNMQYRVNPLVSGGVAAANRLAPNELTTSLAPTEETKYRPYSTDMYERNVKSSDPNFNPLEYTVHRMNPYERAMNTYLRTPEKVKKGDAQLSDFVPSVFQPDF